jgi:acyl-coenzyme A synthetase/AMP-(fatty) acid ligase
VIATAHNHLLWPAIARHLAAGRGDDTALCGAERSVSYAQLAAAVERGAAEIDGRVPAAGRILIAARDQLHVGLWLCAALQSHAVPLLADPAAPGRLASLCSEWNVAAAVLEQPVALGGAIVIRADEAAQWLARPAARAFVPRAVAANDAAFWTFTSGTTGEPKAVVHAHRGPVAAYRAFAQRVVQLGPEDVTIATAGLPFVYALGNNFFFPLMAGATAVLPRDLLLPTVLGELARHGATVLVAGPWSLAGIARSARRERWTEAIRGLRRVLSAGEPLPPAVFLEWKQRFGKELLDNLGCTEMFNSFLSNEPGRARPGSLGHCVPGFEISVGGSAAEPGTRGALHVRGESRAVAIGSDGELAAPEGEWCDTGDFVEVAEDGSLVFLGRRDDRFKVKGRFLHPLEVERVLGEIAGVAECMVAGEPDASGIVAVVARIVPDGRCSVEELMRAVMRQARARLEPHARPAAIEIVAALPRSARGKLQRSAVVG